MDKTNVNALKDNISQELNSIAQRGLNANNFDTCYKLIDMLYKLDMIKVSSGDKKTLYEAYMNAKRVYRQMHTSENEEKIFDSAENYMSMLFDAIQELIKNCDCVHEREILQSYIKRL